MKILVHASTVHGDYRAFLLDNGRCVSELSFHGYSSMIDFIITIGIEYVAINHTRNQEAMPMYRLGVQEIKDSISLQYATRKGRKRYIEVGVE